MTRERTTTDCPAYVRADVRDDMLDLLRRVPGALNNAFSAGIEEREFGSASRQERLMEPVNALREAIRELLSRAEGEAPTRRSNAPGDAAPDLLAVAVEAHALISGDLVGAEWKRACAEFLKRAHEAISRAEGSAS